MTTEQINILHLKMYTLCQEENCKYQCHHNCCKTAIQNKKCKKHTPTLKHSINIHRNAKTGIITITANKIPYSEWFKT